MHSAVTPVVAPRSTLSARTAVDGPAGPQPHVPCPHFIRHRARLGRSLRDLVHIVTTLQERDVGLQSLHEAIDPTPPTGKLSFHVFAALSEFEAERLRERTRRA